MCSVLAFSMASSMVCASQPRSPSPATLLHHPHRPTTCTGWLPPWQAVQAWRRWERALRPWSRQGSWRRPAQIMRQRCGRHAVLALLARAVRQALCCAPHLCALRVLPAPLAQRMPLLRGPGTMGSQAAAGVASCALLRITLSFLTPLPLQADIMGGWDEDSYRDLMQVRMPRLECALKPCWLADWDWGSGRFHRCSRCSPRGPPAAGQHGAQIACCACASSCVLPVPLAGPG